MFTLNMVFIIASTVSQSYCLCDLRRLNGFIQGIKNTYHIYFAIIIIQTTHLFIFTTEGQLYYARLSLTAP